MGLKNIAFRLLNKQQLDFLREKQMGYQLKNYYKKDSQRFKANYSSPRLESLSQEKLDSRIIFFTHSLEKGLSHQNFRKGFGITALTELSNVLFVYRNKGFDLERPIIANAFSTLHEYTVVHNEIGHPLDYFYDIFEGFTEEINHCKATIGGTKVIYLKDKEMNAQKNFSDLSSGRFTIRNFSEENNIAVSDLEEAISIAMKTPSVCNRQPSRVYLIKNKEIIQKTLAIQGGFTGYKLPPYMFLITASLHSFISPTERNEAYIDGGLFSMSLLYALEYKKIAACALNAMFPEEKEQAVRQLLGVDNSEVMIMFIAAGDFLEENIVAKSYRLTAETITKIID